MAHYKHQNGDDLKIRKISHLYLESIYTETKIVQPYVVIMSIT